VNAVPEWAPSGSLVIGMVQGTGTAAATTEIGVMTSTKFTPLPITQTEAIDGVNAYAAF
jgi:hypothetical protein